MKKILFITIISSNITITQASDSYFNRFSNFISDYAGFAKGKAISVASKGVVLGAEWAASYYMPEKIDLISKKIKEFSLNTIQNILFSTGDYVNVDGKDIAVRKGTSSNSFLNLALKATGLPRFLEYPIVFADKALGLTKMLQDKIGDPEKYLKDLLEKKTNDFLSNILQNKNNENFNKNEKVIDKNNVINNKDFEELKINLSIRSKEEIENNIKSWNANDFVEYITYQIHKKANELFKDSVKYVLGNLGNEALSHTSAALPTIAGGIGMAVAGPVGFIGAGIAGLYYNSSFQNAEKEYAINPLIEKYINSTSTWFTKEQVEKYEMSFDDSIENEDGFTILQTSSLNPFAFKFSEAKDQVKEAAFNAKEKAVNLVEEKTKQVVGGMIQTLFAPANTLLDYLDLDNENLNNSKYENYINPTVDNVD